MSHGLSLTADIAMQISCCRLSARSCLRISRLRLRSFLRCLRYAKVEDILSGDVFDSLSWSIAFSKRLLYPLFRYTASQYAIRDDKEPCFSSILPIDQRCVLVNFIIPFPSDLAKLKTTSDSSTQIISRQNWDAWDIKQKLGLHVLRGKSEEVPSCKLSNITRHDMRRCYDERCQQKIIKRERVKMMVKESLLERKFLSSLLEGTFEKSWLKIPAPAATLQHIPVICRGGDWQSLGLSQWVGSFVFSESKLASFAEEVGWRRIEDEVYKKRKKNKKWRTFRSRMLRRRLSWLRCNSSQNCSLSLHFLCSIQRNP